MREWALSGHDRGLLVGCPVRLAYLYVSGHAAEPSRAQSPYHYTLSPRTTHDIEYEFHLRVCVRTNNLQNFFIMGPQEL
jgi:hypothetical protein